MGRHAKKLPEAFALAEQGWNALSIARELGVTWVTVKHWAYRNNVTLPSHFRRPTEQHARAVELATAGLHVAEIARQIGFSHRGVTLILKRAGVEPGKRPSRQRPGATEREEKMASMYRQGVTLEKIGQTFGVTRERVRQLLRKQDVSPADGGASKAARSKSAARQSKRDARSLARYGLPVADMDRWRATGIMSAYRNQENSAHGRGIKWNLRFAEWIDVWVTSGKLEQRGRGKGCYCMSRIKDEGGYEVGNVHIQPCVDNSREAVKQWVGKPKAARGVHRLYPGTGKPYVVKVCKKQIGRYASEQEGVEARLAYIHSNGLRVTATGRVASF